MSNQKLKSALFLTAGTLIFLSYCFLPVFVINAPSLGVIKSWSAPVFLVKIIIAAGSGKGMTAMLVNDVLNLSTLGLAPMGGLIIAAMVLLMVSLIVPVLIIISVIRYLMNKDHRSLMQMIMISSCIGIFIGIAAIILRLIWNSNFRSMLTSLIANESINYNTASTLTNVFQWGAGFIVSLILFMAVILMWIIYSFLVSSIKNEKYLHSGYDDPSAFQNIDNVTGSGYTLRRNPAFIRLESGGNTLKINHVPCVIGRNRSAVDYYLYDESLSRRHCAIDIRNGAVLIKDLNSLYGVWINGERIYSECETVLHDRDVLKLGEVVFHVSIDWQEIHAQMPEKYGTEMFGRSMMPNEAVTQVRNESIIINEGEDQGWIPSVLLCPSEDNRDIGNCYVGKTPFIIGRSRKRADFIIDDLSVSRVHSKLIYQNGAYYIEDMESSNGTLLNNIRLKPGEKKRLEFNDKLDFGDVTMYYRS